MSVHTLSATQALELLRSGETTPAALTHALQERITRFNPTLNAFAHISAQEPETQLPEGPLAGLPITVKDQIHVAGMPCSSGISDLKDFVPAQDAPVITTLKEAGASVLGKTTLPPLAMDFQTNDTLWGTTENPWQQGITAGGSCGGGAAAVAAGLSYVDIGADLAGSLRIPAAFCGVCSLMPTVDALSNAGTMTLVERAGHDVQYLTRVGPIARTVEDLQTIWGALQNRSTATKLPHEPRILVSIDSRQIPVEEAMATTLQSAVNRLEQSGTTVTRTTLDEVDWQSGWQAYGYIQGYQFGAMMTPLQRWVARLAGKGAAKRSPSFIGNIQQGYRRQAEQYEAALSERQRLATSLDRLFEHHDVWMLPVTRVPAFPHVSPSYSKGYLRDYDHSFKIGHKEVNYFEALTQLTTLFNLTGHPVVTLPVGIQPETGLPVGMQLVGKRGGETELLAAALFIQGRLG